MRKMINPDALGRPQSLVCEWQQPLAVVSTHSSLIGSTLGKPG
jgi:hypothetical protein